MKSTNSFLNYDNLRIEIAICQEDIDANNPGIHKFIIPVLCTDDTCGSFYTPSTNIFNKNIVNSGVSITNIDNFIDLRVPKEYTMFYGKDIIPKGTRFIIAFIGGNINDIRIIGRYDNLEDEDGDN